MQTDVLENKTKKMHKITVRTSGDPVASSFILIQEPKVAKMKEIASKT